MSEKKKVVLSGRDIYYDKHNRAIYYNKRSKIAYVVPKNSESMFQNLRNRYVIGIIAFVFSEMLFKINIWISLAIAIGCIAFMEYKYRKSLSEMTQLRNFKPETSKSSMDSMREMDKGALVLRCVLYLALAVLLIVNLFVTEGLLENVVLVIGSIAVSLAAAYMAGKLIYVLLKK